MAAAGLLVPRADHAEAIVEFSLRMLRAIESRKGLDGERIRLRIGINTGPLVAGVIGQDKYLYDMWGDTVNVASRMESSGLSDMIQVTQAVKDRVGDKYPFEERGPVEVKGKGTITTYVLGLEAPAG